MREPVGMDVVQHHIFTNNRADEACSDFSVRKHRRTPVVGRRCVPTTRRVGPNFFAEAVIKRPTSPQQQNERAGGVHRKEGRRSSSRARFVCSLQLGTFPITEHSRGCFAGRGVNNVFGAVVRCFCCDWLNPVIPGSLFCRSFLLFGCCALHTTVVA